MPSTVYFCLWYYQTLWELCETSKKIWLGSWELGVCLLLLFLKCSQVTAESFHQHHPDQQ